MVAGVVEIDQSVDTGDDQESGVRWNEFDGRPEQEGEEMGQSWDCDAMKVP